MNPVERLPQDGFRIRVPGLSVKDFRGLVAGRGMSRAPKTARPSADVFYNSVMNGVRLRVIYARDRAKVREDGLIKVVYKASRDPQHTSNMVSIKMRGNTV